MRSNFRLKHDISRPRFFLISIRLRTYIELRRFPPSLREFSALSCTEHARTCPVFLPLFSSQSFPEVFPGRLLTPLFPDSPGEEKRFLFHTHTQQSLGLLEITFSA